MNLFDELQTRLDTLRGLFPTLEAADEISSAVTSLNDETLCELTDLVAQTMRVYQQFSLASSGAISARSTRAAGHAGLAQSRGFRSPAALIQQITGVSRNTAMQQIRVGESLHDAAGAGAGAGLNGTGLSGEGLALAGADGLPSGAEPQTPWFEPLTAALTDCRLSPEQHDAIRRSIGEPPAVGTSSPNSDDHTDATAGTSETGSEAHPCPEMVEAWRLAAEQLVDYATEVPVEELAKQARAVRDLLDPEGANARYLAKHEARSFTMWTDRDGLTHGKFVFDDESAEWVRSIVNTALRPRRGGPRFVTAEEQARANELQHDPRSNEQLAHDLLIDVLKAGSVADAPTVFGARQAGIKIVQVVNRDDYFAGTPASATYLQESGTIVPAGTGSRHRCNTSEQHLTVDEQGDPLNVGREQRLFTSRQRVALATRDGGCRWTGCDRPASYCEAHHIDQWHADQGRTDIDRGILLCRFHHMQLHNGGWRISREGQGPFLLHPPPTTSARQHQPHRSTQIGEAARNRTHPGFEGTAVPTAGAPPTIAAAADGAPPTVSTDGMPPIVSTDGAPPAVAADGAPPTVPAGEPPWNASAGETPPMPGRSPEPIELRPPLLLTYAWQSASPPAKRFRKAA